MKLKVNQITYNNTRQDSQFDLVRLIDLMKREKLKNTFFEFQQIDFYLLLFISHGTGKHTIDFTDYEYRKGTLLSIRKDQIHRFFESDAQGYLLLFTDDFLMQFIEQSEIVKSLQLFNELIASPKIQLENDTYKEFFQLIQEIQHEYEGIKDEHSLGIVGNLLQIFFRKTLRIKSKSSQVLTQKKYLEEFVQLQNLVEKQCFKMKKVVSYASQMAVSSKTLNNITRQIVNKSAKQFIDEIIITQVKRLLVNTQLSVKEIAYEAGFDEPTNFYKFFKKHTSVTPEVFRKSN